MDVSELPAYCVAQHLHADSNKSSVYRKASKAIGDAHVTFMVLPDPAEGTDKHLRIGGMSQILLYNRESDDATLPELSPQGIASSKGLPANTWECFESHIGTDGTIETWLNGEAIAGLSYGPGISNPNSNAWGRSSVKPKPTGVYFGWESYGGDANTFWYDDVAIGSSRIGCGSTGPASSATSAPASTSKTTLVTSTTTKSTTVSEGTTGRSTSTTSTSKTSTTSNPPAITTTPGDCTAARWAQCDGIGYAGCKTCAAPYKCQYSNDWYSQCL